MNGFVLFFALLSASLAQSSKNNDVTACGLCTFVVSSLESYASTKTTKEQLNQYIKTAANQVCEKIPSDFISRQECTSFIELYGPYTVDMVLSNTAPLSVCSNLGMCATSDQTFDLIFPVITNDRVIYSVSQSNVQHKGQKFFYKMFLGNPSFLSGDSLTLRLLGNKDFNMGFEIVNKEKHFDEVVQCPLGTHMSCSSYVSSPGRGVWYFVTVTVGDFAANHTVTNAHFNLTAIIQSQMEFDHNMDFPFSNKSHKTRVWTFIVPIIIFALCLTCCCALRRRCKRSCEQRKFQQVELEAPVGYYYPPPPQGQYPMYYPMDMQNIPQPIYIVTKPE